MDRAVTTTDDNDILAAKESAVTRRASRDAPASEFLLAWDAQFAQRAPDANDDRLGMISLVFLIRQREALAQVDLCGTRSNNPNCRLARILEEMDSKS